LASKDAAATSKWLVKNAVLEAVLIGAVGAVLAFAANAFSPRGLKLTRNYAPGVALAASRSLGNPIGTNGTSAGRIEAQLRAEGLQLVDSNQVAKLFTDPKREHELVIFVDARDDDHYQAGHVPGAYQLDHYHPENYLAAVLPACQLAEKIVVYCKGGSCEDSEQTAIFLRDANVPRDRLFVYAGGFDEWKANHMPVEVGHRNSGQFEQASPVSSAAPGGPK
jgi:rhodanese-related sulfurtransferase